MTTQRCCKRNSHVAGDDLAQQRTARNGAGKRAAGLQPVSKLPTEIERTDRERQVLLGSQRHVTVGVPGTRDCWGPREQFSALILKLFDDNDLVTKVIGLQRRKRCANDNELR